MTLPRGSPDGDPPESHHAVAAAAEARAELMIDGSAPSTEAILREMGRDSEGVAVEDGADDPSEAGAAARRLLGYDAEGSA